MVMTKKERDRRFAEMVADESRTGQTEYWWLSFCDPDRPDGDQFLGVSIVKSVGFVSATIDASLHGCNPGGEVQGYSMRHLVPPEKYTNRLLTRVEAKEVDKIMSAS